MVEQGNIKTAGWFGPKLDLFKGTPSRPSKPHVTHQTNQQVPEPEDTPIGIIYGAGLMILVILGGVLHMI